MSFLTWREATASNATAATPAVIATGGETRASAICIRQVFYLSTVRHYNLQNKNISRSLLVFRTEDDSHGCAHELHPD